MLSSTLYLSSIAVLASLVTIKADSQEFGLISIRSGSALQYAGITLNIDGATDGYYPVRVGGRSYETYVVDDEGRLVANSTYYWGLIPDTDGQYGATTDSANAITGFSIEDGNLASADGYAFVAVPDGTAWDLYSANAVGNNGNTNNNVGLALAAYTTSGFASDFEPSVSTDSSSSNTTTSETSSTYETTTLAPSENTTTTISSATDSSSGSTSATVIGTSSIAADFDSSSSFSTASNATQTTATSTATSSSNTTTNSTSSATTTNSKNAANVNTKGSISLLAMGLVGLFL
ncbi:hypothetical protein HANVADRAFT_54208 [Hanseniaspora valbyensis NRRL Y-1626]|uniref:Cell wall protein n=1 Tax=Hanseniaspora valbyensis NRRL Y-1626 TaxID=766949 RepID=A0A1B7T8C2_9ASCO|nr:hypothetical protein HANVADRAFT_54208 [Hanseniaspora valbyensis NRRL Y-1626]